MSQLLLSRARLRRNVPSATLRLLVTADDSQRFSAGHRLVWALFDDSPDRRRDFLWRETAFGCYYLLSERPPMDRHGLFDVDPPKPFQPSLRHGDRLGFMLRANATVARGGGRGVRGKPCDVVMDALRSIPSGRRAVERHRVVGEVGHVWLSRQGEEAGFALAGAEGTSVAAYHAVRVEHGSRPACLGIIDFEGMLEVREPEPFLRAIARGFGRAKAFGCGLMLIRRA